MAIKQPDTRACPASQHFVVEPIAKSRYNSTSWRCGLANRGRPIQQPVDPDPQRKEPAATTWPWCNGLCECRIQSCRTDAFGADVQLGGYRRDRTTQQFAFSVNHRIARGIPRAHSVDVQRDIQASRQRVRRGQLEPGRSPGATPSVLHLPWQHRPPKAGPLGVPAGCRGMRDRHGDYHCSWCGCSLPEQPKSAPYSHCSLTCVVEDLDAARLEKAHGRMNKLYAARAAWRVRLGIVPVTEAAE